MNKKKLVTTLGSLALVGAIGVGATLAYLTSNTGPVTNTFTLSDNVKIVLDEANTDQDKEGEVTPLRDTSNDYENVVYGVNLPKDPTVTLQNEDLQQFAFIAVDTGDDMQIVDLSNKWREMYTEGTITIYAYCDGTGVNIEDYYVNITDDTKTSEQEESEGYKPGIQLPALFEHVTLKEGKDTIDPSQEYKKLDDIKLAAAAIQTDGIKGDQLNNKTAIEVALDQVKTGLLNLIK